MDAGGDLGYAVKGLMSAVFRTINRDTPMLMPASIQEWLPEQHLARFVVEMVDQHDLGEITSRYGGGGKQAYHPAMLVALLCYGYATGVFSSRKLEQATYDSVAVRYISAAGIRTTPRLRPFASGFWKNWRGCSSSSWCWRRRWGYCG